MPTITVSVRNTTSRETPCDIVNIYDLELDIADVTARRDRDYGCWYVEFIYEGVRYWAYWPLLEGRTCLSIRREVVDAALNCISSYAAPL